jgi:hypothetical protein
MKIAISVEGKADESFGASITATLAAVKRRKARGKTTNGDARVEGLIKAILQAEASRSKLLGKLPYQLFTAVAGVLTWAKWLRADVALVVIHEFVGGRRTDGRTATIDANVTRNGKALDSFVTHVGGAPVMLTPGCILGPFHVPGNAFVSGQIPLYVGKTRRTLTSLGD